MKIYNFGFWPIDSKMYVITEGNKALVIDPCINQDAFNMLKNNQIKQVTIILTHEHYDHISGVNAFKERYACEVICSKKCADNIRDPKRNISQYYDVLMIGKDEEPERKTEPYSCTATQSFEDTFCCEWEGHKLFLRETPGHSEGSICIFLDDKILFTGDSLLKNVKVITKLKTGSKDKYNSVTKPFLEAVLSDVYIYPGHGESGYRKEFAVE